MTLAAATAPRPRASERLLLVEPARARFRDLSVRELPHLLAPGDALVVNDAATLPASIRLTSHDAELRLAAHAAGGAFVAVALGTGTWRTPTETRGTAPRFEPGERVASAELTGRVVAVDAADPELVTVRFEQTGAAFERALYARGRVVQYAYLERELELWDVQSGFSARPWAFESPSAGLPLTFGLLCALRRRGVELGALTHAAGLSSTGSASLDRRLPLPERYEIPEATRALVERTRARGGRVVAVGTTVVRALESSAREHGAVTAGAGRAELVIGPGFRPRVADGVLTGMHEPGTSHFALLSAFAPPALLERALGAAERAGYVQHEFGDACLILGRS
ncbi:MAG TPA: S-adenosylmethionine:tRNA ribosyltransferase-isomerase [Polyangiaceae bacterium]|nr:S-adenosylmethionine:tRNA ribosyltransferase-isomerase [Polyangiaceae bacterium]